MFASQFDNWQVSPPPGRHDRCSPNLVLLLGELRRRYWGMSSLGCYGSRAIRGGSAASSHSYGAALDAGFHPEMNAIVGSQVTAWLVARSEELHVQAVHDYRRSRIWRAGRTPDPGDACGAWWKAQRPSSITGMGQSWANHLHIEVTALGWGDTTPILERWVE